MSCLGCSGDSVHITNTVIMILYIFLNMAVIMYIMCNTNKHDNYNNTTNVQ